MQVLFCKLTKKIFKFIETDYEFKLLYCDNSVVKYENSSVVISIFMEPSSCEVYIIFELQSAEGTLHVRMDETARVYSQTSLLSRCYYATDDDMLKRYLNEAKKFIIDYCRAFVNGNLDVYLEFTNKREQKRIIKLREIKKGEFASKINLLWKDKDYEGIVKLCENQEDNLSKSQLLKYYYSKKMISN